ncbi:MAG TPA: HEAT repeat domain-containing protein [Pyrinomonadaceae bacterium]
MSYALNALKQVRPNARALLVAVAALGLSATGAGSAATKADGTDQDLKKFNQFVQTSNTPAMRALREGRDLIDAEQWAKAAEKFSQFVNAYPKDRDVDVALYWLAYSLNKQGDPRGAAAQLQRLLKKHAQSSWADDARAMLNEIAGTLGEGGIAQNTLNDSQEQEEIKIVALQSLFQSNPERAMTYVREIIKPGSTAGPRLMEAAVSLVGAHGGAQAIPFLLDIARSQADEKLRARAIHSLANEGGEAVLDPLIQLYDAERNSDVKRQMLHAFFEMDEVPRAHAKLLAIARSRTESDDLRRAAIHWIGERETPAAFDELVQLYNSEPSIDIKRQIIHGFFDTKDARAHSKLVEIARSPGEHIDMRRQAVHWLGEQKSPAAFDSLAQIYGADSNVDIKRQIIHALSEMDDPRAQAKISEIARSASESVEVRRQAIHQLGERGESALDELMRIYASERNNEIRRQIIHAFSEMKSPRARQKLIEAARTGDDVELRRAAIHQLAEGDDAQTLDMLISMYDAETQHEVKRQLLHAFSESKHKRALQKLMDVARRDSSVELRKQAIHWIGESDDPDALKFLEDLLKP